MARSLRSDRVLTGSREASQPGSDAPLALGFVGSGRAARALARSLARRGNHVLVARHGDSAARMAEDLRADLVSASQTLAIADVTILAVPDGEVAAVFLLPFVAIRLVAGDRQSGALKIEAQHPMPAIARIGAKALVLLVAWIVASAPAAVDTISTRPPTASGR